LLLDTEAETSFTHSFLEALRTRRNYENTTIMNLWYIMKLLLNSESTYLDSKDGYRIILE